MFTHGQLSYSWSNLLCHTPSTISDSLKFHMCLLSIVCKQENTTALCSQFPGFTFFPVCSEEKEGCQFAFTCSHLFLPCQLTQTTTDAFRHCHKRKPQRTERSPPLTSQTTSRHPRWIYQSSVTPVLDNNSLSRKEQFENVPKTPINICISTMVNAI